MRQHEMKLWPLPFEQMISGKKTIEARLYDEKRRLVQLGDEIKFVNTDMDETFMASIVGLLRYANLQDMFTYKDKDPQSFSALMKVAAQ